MLFKLKKSIYIDVYIAVIVNEMSSAMFIIGQVHNYPAF